MNLLPRFKYMNIKHYLFGIIFITAFFGVSHSAFAVAITDCAGFQNINSGLGLSYELSNDITCSGAFTRIGNPGAKFTGTFDGNGHKIYNITISQPGTSWLGVFGYINGATIQDVIFDNITITGSQNVGLIGTADNSTISGVGLRNSTISGDSFVGGLIGNITNTNVSASFVDDLTISGTNGVVGGLFGIVSNVSGLITNSYARNINASSSAGGNVAGIAGEDFWTSGTSTYTNVYSTGSISGGGNSGGLFGIITGDHDVIVNNAFSDTSVNANASNFGLTGEINTGSGSVFAPTNVYWNNRPDNPAQCYQTGSTGCTVINNSTSHFYVQGNAPLSAWSFPGVWHMTSTYPELAYADITEFATLTTPAAGNYSTSIAVNYALPETPLAGSIKLVFTGPSTVTATLADVAAGNHTFTLTTNSAGLIASSPAVTSYVGGVSTLAEGTYSVELQYQDSYGSLLAGTGTSGIIIDRTVPVITLLGSPHLTMNVGDNYTNEGATAVDNIDGTITSDIVVVNSINTAAPGAYTITYNVADAAGNNAAQVVRTATVSAQANTGGSGGGGGGAYNPSVVAAKTTPLDTKSKALSLIKEVAKSESIDFSLLRNRVTRKGQEGKHVRALQQFLNTQKLTPKPMLDDGGFGPKTDQVVRMFQKVHKLRVDGVVGPKTVALMESLQ